MAAVLTLGAFLAGNMLVQLFLLPPPVDHFEFLTRVYRLPLCYGAALLFLPSTQAQVATLQTGEDMQALIGRADKALYAAKEQGRNRVVQHAAEVLRRAPGPVSA